MRYGYKPHTIHEYEQLSNEIRKEMARRGVAANAGCLTRKLLKAPSNYLIEPGNVVVTREEFNHWLSGEKELITTLDDSEWLSCRTAE